MNIHSWNVNGLRAIMGKGFLDYINEYDPDILCIQETKLQESNLKEELTNINNYYSYFSHAEKKGFSGVATYTKEKPISIKHGIGIEEFDSEGRILITEFKEFTLLNIYFPNGQKDENRLDYKLRFYDAILDYCNSEVKEGKKLVICGDYNTAHTENGYTDTFRKLNEDLIKYSWWSYRFKARERNTGWRIDYHFVSNNLIDSVKDAGILNEVYGSDHCPITINLEF